MRGVLAPKVDTSESPFGGQDPRQEQSQRHGLPGLALIPPTHTQHHSEREGHSGEWDVRELLV